MKTRSHKEFIKPTAEELDASEILVEDVVEFFYSTLHKMIDSMEHPQIEVVGLGTFKVRPNKLDELIDDKKRFLDSMGTPTTMTKMTIKRNVEVQWERAQNLKEKVEEENKRREEFRKQKYGESNQNMEEQREDS